MRSVCWKTLRPWVISFLVMVPWLAARPVAAAIPGSQRDALVAIYQSLGGSGWTNKTNWLGAIGTECTWYGVTCDGAGTKVEGLSFFSNNLQGTLPEALGSLVDLRRLSLGGSPTNVTGPLPTSIGNLHQLTSIVITQAAIAGPLPASMVDLDNLFELRIFSTGNLGQWPSWLGELDNLTWLYFGGFEGTLPASVADLTRLRIFYLDGNRFTGGPPNLSALSDLNQLLFFRSFPTQNVPGWIKTLTNLDSLGLDGFVGPFPNWVCQLPKLRYLNLNRNAFNAGPIPACIGQLANLELLILTGTHRTGALPAALGNLARYQLGSSASFPQLELNLNSLTGPLPASFTKLKGSIRLGGNLLSGSVPAEFANIDKTKQFFSLYYNALDITDAAVLANLGDLRFAQTLPPSENLSVIAPTRTSLTVRWKAVRFTSQPGTIEIHAATDPAGTFQKIGTVPSTATKFVANGLAPNTKYYFKLMTINPPHAGNPNVVQSAFSAVKTGRTKP